MPHFRYNFLGYLLYSSFYIAPKSKRATSIAIALVGWAITLDRNTEKKPWTNIEIDEAKRLSATNFAIAKLGEW